MGGNTFRKRTVKCLNIERRGRGFRGAPGGGSTNTQDIQTSAVKDYLHFITRQRNTPDGTVQTFKTVA